MPKSLRKRKLDDEKPDIAAKAKPAEAAEAAMAEITHWLIKSEPETRMEKGVDMRFSFDDLKWVDRFSTFTLDKFKGKVVIKLVKLHNFLAQACYTIDWKAPTFPLKIANKEKNRFYFRNEKDSTACWDGVRNYQARNFMRSMKVCICN